MTANLYDLRTLMSTLPQISYAQTQQEARMLAGDWPQVAPENLYTEADIAQVREQARVTTERLSPEELAGLTLDGVFDGAVPEFDISDEPKTCAIGTARQCDVEFQVATRIADALDKMSERGAVLMTPKAIAEWIRAGAGGAL